MTPLTQIGGCSACACGIVEACPYYVAPELWPVVAVTFVVVVGLFIYKLRASKVFRLFHALFTAAVIGLVVMLYLTVGKTILGNQAWNDTMKSYQQCVENAKNNPTQISCEY